VGAVIPPWNFPFAIMAGMTAAAIVTGNTVILKPSSDSPTIAAKFLRSARRSRPARRRGQLLPRLRSTFGNAIVEHPKTRFIAFTGSRKSASTSTSAPPKPSPARSGSSAPSSRWAARTPSSSRRLPTSTRPSTASSPRPSDSAARSAPPAPAPSSKLHLRRLCRAPARARRHAQGRRSRENFYAGPVINKAALDSMLGYIEIGKQEGRLIAGGNAVETADGGYYLEPTVFADVAPNARIAQEEIFGPVLAVIKSNSFEEASPSPTTPSTASPAPSTPPTAKSSTAPARVPRRQSLLQPQVHRRDGRRAPLRRLQHERHRLQGRRPRLSLPVHAGQELIPQAIQCDQSSAVSFVNSSHRNGKVHLVRKRQLRTVKSLLFRQGGFDLPNQNRF
jgi:hypothetical protein